MFTIVEPSRGEVDAEHEDRVLKQDPASAEADAIDPNLQPGRLRRIVQEPGPDPVPSLDRPPRPVAEEGSDALVGSQVPIFLRQILQ